MRGSFLSFLLLLSLVLVGTKIYRLWEEWWEPPHASVVKPHPIAPELKKNPEQTQPVNIKTIIEKNPFDPDRERTKTASTEGSSIAAQKIKNIVLLGTVILGDSRYAIVEQASGSAWPGGKGHAGQSAVRVAAATSGRALPAQTRRSQQRSELEPGSRSEAERNGSCSLRSRGGEALSQKISR